MKFNVGPNIFDATRLIDQSEYKQSTYHKKAGHGDAKVEQDIN
jgi:hypothetical protein